MIISREISTPAGGIVLAAEEKEALLTGLWFTGQRYFGSTLPEKVPVCCDFPLFRETEKWLRCYFSGGRPDPRELPLAPAGTPFRRMVWRLLREIPYGEVTTYGALAARAAAISGKSFLSAQAVGSAVGHNPIAILIPCHRVVGRNGSLTGFAAGLSVKAQLLQLEGVSSGI